ncbi:MAG TPA: SRPBCC family protein [Chloroflexota bacterium]|nr:SRPBCC family protein [Chloroflexota bacterium]
MGRSIIESLPILNRFPGGQVIVKASIIIDAPRDEVFAIMTDYGQDVRRRISPDLKSQEVVRREDNLFVCNNVWDRGGKTFQQQRNYRVIPPDTIEEEAIDNGRRLSLIISRFEVDGDATRLTVSTDYHLTGIWRVLGRFIASKLRESDEELLAKLKTGIEAEFEDVDEA